METIKAIMEAVKEKIGKITLLPKWWNLALLFMLFLGWGLILCNMQEPQFSNLSKRVRPDAWLIFIGILLSSVVITHGVSFIVSRSLRSILNLKGKDTNADMFSPALVGICESIMYPMSFFVGEPKFIGVWLAVKVAGQWVRWKGDDKKDKLETDIETETLNEGRRRFNGFLVGNAVSIMFGVITWGVIKIWVLKITP